MWVNPKGTTSHEKNWRFQTKVFKSVESTMTHHTRFCLVIACTVMAGLIQAAIPARRSIEARLKNIGEYFCQQVLAGTTDQLKDSRNVPDVVRVGQSLPDVLAEMRPDIQQGYIVESAEGEPESAGKDERVTHSLFIRCDAHAICLRMRYDPIKDNFHIVGYCGANRRPPPAAARKP